MAALGGYPCWGYPGGSAGGEGTFQFTLNQSTDQFEVIFQVPPGAASYTITKLGYNQNATTGTSPAYKISLQGVDSSGNPDGTIKGGGSPASKTFTPSNTNDGTFRLLTLDNSYSASPGEFLALVIAYSSGTIDGSNNLQVIRGSAALGSSSQFPYCITNDAGSRTRQSVGPVFAWGTVSKNYGCTAEYFSSYAYGSTSSPDERGVRFSLPSGMCTSYKVAGARVECTSDASGGSILMTLYDTDGTTVLQQVTIDGDALASTSRFVADFFFDESSLSALTPGSVYRLTFAPQNTTTFRMTYMGPSDLTAFPFGNSWYGTNRTDSGGWTDPSNELPLIGLLISDLTG